MRKRNAVKKIAAVLASACLIVSMLATTVMAKPATTGTTGSLTIKAKTGETLNGYTFDLYRVADIAVDGEGKMTYTVKEKYKSALNSATDLEDQTKVEENLKALVTASATDEKFATKIATSGEASVRFDSVDMGYYLVRVSAPEGATSATGDFLVSVPSTKAEGSDLVYDVTVTVKTSTVTIEKEGKVEGAATGEKTVKVGDKINYTLNMKVPDTTGFSKYVYKVTDTMDKGLAFDENSLNVYVGNSTIPMAANNYQLSKNSSTGKTEIVVNFNDTLFVKTGGTGNPTEYPAGTALKITYSATVTKDAITTGKDGVSNTAKLEFSNKPGSEGTGSTGETPAPEKPTFYTFNLKVDKTFAPALVDANDAKKVTFKLKDVKVKEVTTGTAGVYIVDPDGTDMNLKLANDNTLSVSGLAAGTYYLDETATVPGYNLLKSTIKIVISPTYGTDGKLTGYTADTSKIDIDNQNTVTVSVENKKGFTLPSTGGQGMVALVAAGICLMAAMAALMVSYMRKRRNA